jgi:hypothetical protein
MLHMIEYFNRGTKFVISWVLLYDFFSTRVLRIMPPQHTDPVQRCWLCNNSNATATRIVIRIMASGAISRLCKHSFNVCSDLPKINPIFSSSACDLWRERVHSVNCKDRSSVDISLLSSNFQCQHQKKGYSSIHIRVSFDPKKGIKEAEEITTNIEECKGYRKTQSIRKLNIKSKRSKMTLDRLHKSKITTLANKNSELKEELSKAGDVVTNAMANAKVQQEQSNVL